MTFHDTEAQSMVRNWEWNLQCLALSLPLKCMPDAMTLRGAKQVQCQIRQLWGQWCTWAGTVASARIYTSLRKDTLTAALWGQRWCDLVVESLSRTYNPQHSKREKKPTFFGLYGSFHGCDFSWTVSLNCLHVSLIFCKQSSMELSAVRES